MASKTAMFMQILHKRFSLSCQAVVLRLCVLLLFVVGITLTLMRNSSGAPLALICRLDRSATSLSIPVIPHKEAAARNNSDVAVFPRKQTVNRMSGGFIPATRAGKTNIQNVPAAYSVSSQIPGKS